MALREQTPGYAIYSEFFDLQTTTVYCFLGISYFLYNYKVYTDILYTDKLYTDKLYTDKLYTDILYTYILYTLYYLYIFYTYIFYTDKKSEEIEITINICWLR